MPQPVGEAVLVYFVFAYSKAEPHTLIGIIRTRSPAGFAVLVGGVL